MTPLPALATYEKQGEPHCKGFEEEHQIDLSDELFRWEANDIAVLSRGPSLGLLLALTFGFPAILPPR